MTSKEQAAGPFGLSEVEGPSTSLGVNGPESVLFVGSEVEGGHADVSGTDHLTRRIC